LKSYCKFIEAYSKVQIQFSAAGELIKKKWLNFQSTAASSHKAEFVICSNFATLIVSSKRATSTAQLFAAHEAH